MHSAAAYIGKSGSRLIRLIGVLAIAVAVLFIPHAADAASLSVLPVGGSSVSVGQLFSVTVIASANGGQTLNAVSGVISFPQDLLQIVSVDKSGSIINFWISEPSSGIGRAQFEGGIYNPGYGGSQGRVVTYVFKAKAKGTANIVFSSASILANDGQGTSILERTNPARISITETANEEVAPESSMPIGIAIRSATHPDQNAWYNMNMVALSWDLPGGVTSVRTGVDHSKQSTPTTVSSPAISETTLTLEDGTWYFHIQTKDEKGWSSVSTFKINIDTQAVSPPVFDAFPVNIIEGEVLLVSGSAPQNAVINMTLKNSDGQVSTQSAKAGSDGRFQAVWPKKLDSDSYTLNAEAINSKGLKSLRSKDVVITVHPTAIQRVAKPVIDVVTIIALIAGVIILCTLWIWYLLQRARRFRRQVRGDIKRAGQLVHAEFRKLLEQARSKRKLTAEEERMMSILREEIQQVEEEIESKVRDIGR